MRCHQACGTGNYDRSEPPSSSSGDDSETSLLGGTVAPRSWQQAPAQTSVEQSQGVSHDKTDRCASAPASTRAISVSHAAGHAQASHRQSSSAREG